MSETQRITEIDCANGRIRVPRSAKKLFPSDKAQISIVLKSNPLSCVWDPRTGPDRERSGVISIGKENMRSISIGSRLTITNEGNEVRLG